MRSNEKPAWIAAWSRETRDNNIPRATFEVLDAYQDSSQTRIDYGVTQTVDASIQAENFGHFLFLETIEITPELAGPVPKKICCVLQFFVEKPKMQ